MTVQHFHCQHSLTFVNLITAAVFVVSTTYACTLTIPELIDRTIEVSTCNDYYLRGCRTSGVYILRYFDDRTKQFDHSTVYCDMTGQSGVTVFHNSLSQNETWIYLKGTGVHQDGSFSVKLSYQRDISAIKHVIGQSEECQQSIFVRCHQMRSSMGFGNEDIMLKSIIDNTNQSITDFKCEYEETLTLKDKDVGVTAFGVADPQSRSSGSFKVSTSPIRCSGSSVSACLLNMINSRSSLNFDTRQKNINMIQKVSFHFRTRSSNSKLFSLSNINNESFEIAIAQGRILLFAVNEERDPWVVNKQLDDDEWHLISVEQKDNYVYICFDFDCTKWRSLRNFNSFTHFNLGDKDRTTSFVGCVYNLKVNDNQICSSDLGKSELSFSLSTTANVKQQVNNNCSLKKVKEKNVLCAKFQGDNKYLFINKSITSMNNLTKYSFAFRTFQERGLLLFAYQRELNSPNEPFSIQIDMRTTSNLTATACNETSCSFATIFNKQGFNDNRRHSVQFLSFESQWYFTVDASVERLEQHSSYLSDINIILANYYKPDSRGVFFGGLYMEDYMKRELQSFINSKPQNLQSFRGEISEIRIDDDPTLLTIDTFISTNIDKNEFTCERCKCGGDEEIWCREDIHDSVSSFCDCSSQLMIKAENDSSGSCKRPKSCLLIPANTAYLINFHNKIDKIDQFRFDKIWFMFTVNFYTHKMDKSNLISFYRIRNSNNEDTVRIRIDDSSKSWMLEVTFNAGTSSQFTVSLGLQSNIEEHILLIKHLSSTQIQIQVDDEVKIIDFFDMSFFDSAFEIIHFPSERSWPLQITFSIQYQTMTGRYINANMTTFNIDDLPPDHRALYSVDCDFEHARRQFANKNQLAPLEEPMEIKMGLYPPDSVLDLNIQTELQNAAESSWIIIAIVITVSLILLVILIIISVVLIKKRRNSKRASRNNSRGNNRRGPTTFPISADETSPFRNTPPQMYRNAREQETAGVGGQEEPQDTDQGGDLNWRAPIRHDTGLTV